MSIQHIVNPNGQRRSPRSRFRAGVSLSALGVGLTVALVTTGPAAAGCSFTGTVETFQCDSGGVNIQPYDTGTLDVSDMAIDGWINYSVRPTGVTTPIAVTLTVTDTTVDAMGNGAVNVSSQNYAANIEVTLGSDVTLENTGGSGGLWVRNQIGGDIVIASGAEITSTGSVGLTGTSNAGSVEIANTGHVTSTDNIGIYADASPVDGTTPTVVSVDNSGIVDAHLAGIRVIGYLGAATLDNSGTVTSTTRQALVAWTQSGDLTVENSGTATSLSGIGVDAASDDGNVKVVNGATGVIHGATSGVWLDGTTNRLENDGSIATTGGVAVQTGDGDSTIVLNGSISAGSAADTAISMGTGSNRLVLSDTASLTGKVVNAGSDNTLELTGSASGTLALDVSATGDLQGFSSLEKSGSGLWILTGDTTSLESTTISAGTLQVGDGGTSGSLSGDVVNESDLVFDRSDDVTYAGAVSGTGALTKTGEGTLILTGENTYSGGTLIAEGTLQIGDGGTTGSIQGNVSNSGTLVFDRSGSFDFPGTISGSGAVVIRGGSTVTFTGATGYDGDIAVEGSSFALASGSYSASSYKIGDGGTISGSGTIAGLAVTSGGAVAPGYSPGTLTVSGDVSFGLGSTYDVDVTPEGDHDLIVATGTATLDGGTVAVHATPGGYSPTSTVSILQAAGGVEGEFASVTSDLAFLTPLLSYGDTDVFLTLQRNDISFVSQATTANQRAVAQGAEPLGWSDPVYSALATLAVGKVPAAFDSLSGEAYASSAAVMLQQSRHLRDAVAARIDQAFAPAATGGPATAALAPGLAPTVWLQGYGAWGRSDGDGNAAGVASDVAGTFAGADVAIGDAWRLGLVGGYSRSGLDVADRMSSGSIDSYELGLYAGGRLGSVDLTAGVGHAWHDVAMIRAIAFPGYAGAVRGGYEATTTQVFGEAAYTVDLEGVALQPFAGLAYVHLGAGDLAETGATAALSGRVGAMDTLFSRLGLRLDTRVALAAGRSVRPHVSLAWLHAAGDVGPTARLALAGGAQGFGVAGVAVARDSALIGAGVDYGLGANASLSARYSGQFAAGLVDSALDLSLHVTF